MADETESKEEILQNDESTTTIIPTATAVTKPKIRGRKAPSLPIIERKNWLIHLHYVRKEYDTCKSLIHEQLKETNGQCEYAVYIQAMIMRSEGNIQQSLELFQACHLLNEKNPENLKQVAKNLILLGKHKSAIECYNRAAELGEKDWDICHCFGVCYQFLKQYEKAESSFKESLTMNRHIITYTTLSKLYLENNEEDKAMEILKKGVEFAPENTEVLTSLGLLQLRKNNFHKAFELLGQALTFDPENYKAILAAGSLMQKHGDYDVALTKYRVAAQSVPESSSLWNNIAMCFFGKKKYIAAISCLKRSHYLSPFDWRILYNLSLLHLTMQQYASAFQFASTAISLKSNYGPLFMLLAAALSNLGQDENAERAYEQAIVYDSNDVYTLVNYCVFLHNHSKSMQAVKLLTKFHKYISQDETREADKELIEVSKRLSAALNVGDKLVAEKEKQIKKKKTKEKGNKHMASSRDVGRGNDLEGAPVVRQPLEMKSLQPLSDSGLSAPSKLPPLTSLPQGEDGGLPNYEDVITQNKSHSKKEKNKKKEAIMNE